VVRPKVLKWGEGLRGGIWGLCPQKKFGILLSNLCILVHLEGYNPLKNMNE